MVSEWEKYEFWNEKDCEHSCEYIGSDGSYNCGDSIAVVKLGGSVWICYEAKLSKKCENKANT